MKKILTITLIIISLNSLAKQDTIYFSDLSNLVEATIENCTNNYTVGGIEFQTNESKRYFIQNELPYSFIVSYPIIENLNQFNEYFKTALFYSNQDVYYAKIFGNELFDYLLYTLHRRDSRKIDVSKEVKLKYTDTLVSHILNKSKMPYVESLTSSLSVIRKEFITENLIGALEKFLVNPFYTNDQIELFIQATKPVFDHRDTLKKYSINSFTGSSIKTSNWRKEAKKANQTLTAYLDSMQLIENEKTKNIIGTEITNIVIEIIDLVGINYIVSLAPNIENIIEKLNSSDAYRAKLVLARLHYKNYEKRIIEEISEKLNKYLNESLENNRHLSTRLSECSRDLSYIASQNSYYAKSPLILCKVKVYTPFGYVNYNQIFLEKLHSDIKNLPIGFDEEYKPYFKEDAMREESDFIYDGAEAPDSFFQAVYEWMIENKGNYEFTDF